MDTRLAVGLVLVAVSVVGGLRLSARGEDLTAVYVAARDLPAGHAITRDDLSVARVQVEGASLDQLLPASAGPPMMRILQYRVTAGSFLAVSALGSSAPSGGSELTIPVTADHALGGDLTPGDRVDVLASFGKGTDAAKTLTVAAGARVVDVVRSDGLFGQQQGGLSALTVRVAADDAVFVAFAARNGELDIVRASRSVRDAARRFDLSELP